MFEGGQLIEHTPQCPNVTVWTQRKRRRDAEDREEGGMQRTGRREDAEDREEGGCRG